MIAPITRRDIPHHRESPGRTLSNRVVRPELIKDQPKVV